MPTIRWHDIIRVTESVAGETTGDSKNYFLKKQPLLVQAHAAQNYVSMELASLDAVTPFTFLTKARMKDCKWASIGGGLPNNPTYTSNVFTAGGNSTLTLNGTVVALDEFVFVEGESTAKNDGIYQCSDAGSATTPWELTRWTGWEEGSTFIVGQGSRITDDLTHRGTEYYTTVAGTVGTTDPAFALGSSTHYDLPADFFRSVSVSFDATVTELREVGQVDARDLPGGETKAYTIRNKKITLKKRPTVANQRVVVNYKRKTAPYAFRIRNNGNTESADVTINYVNVILVNDAGTDTYTFAANTTITAMVAAINADSGISLMVAEISNGIVGTTESTELAIRATVSVLSADSLVFIEPELSEDMIVEILAEFINWRLAATDGTREEAKDFKRNYFEAIARHKPLYQKSLLGSRQQDGKTYDFS